MSNRVSRMPTVSIFQPTVVRKGRKTRSKVWWFGWRDQAGKLHRESSGSKSKSMARQLAAKLCERLQLGAAGIHEGYVFSLQRPWTEFVTEFLENRASRQAATTKMAYVTCLSAFTKTVSPATLGDITLPLLDEFVAKRLAQGRARPTINKELRHLRAMLRWLHLRHYLPEVPDFGSLFLRLEEKQPVTVPEPDFLAMVAALNRPDLKLAWRPAAWWRIFLYVAYYLGFRRGEIVGLTWDRISFDTLEVVVAASSSKGKKDRVVPMAPELAALLKEWRANQSAFDPQGKVLPWPYNGFRKLYDDWHAIQAAASIPEGNHYVPKNCRSSCASELIASGVPTVVVKDFLGHASVTTTERYYINTRPALRAAANARKMKLA